MLMVVLLGSNAVSPPSAHAISPLLWVVAAPIADKGLNSIFYPDRRRTYPASAPTVEFRLPDKDMDGKLIRGLVLPPWKSTRQVELIVKKGLNLTVKPGVNGPTIRQLELWVDGDERSKGIKKEPPFSFEIDTANKHYEVGGVYTIGMRYDCGKHQEGFNAIQITIADDSFIENAWNTLNEEYRAALAIGGLNTVPSVPVATVVTREGQVRHVLGNSGRSALTPPPANDPPPAGGAGQNGCPGSSGSPPPAAPTPPPTPAPDPLAISVTREDSGEVVKDSDELIVVDGEPLTLKVALGKGITKITLSTSQGEDSYGTRECAKLERIVLKASSTGKGGLVPLEEGDSPYLIAIGVQDATGKRREFRFKVLVYGTTEEGGRS